MAKKRRMSDIKFEKGDTLGGTAPLLLMNSIRPVPRTSPGLRRFGRNRHGGSSSVLGVFLTIIFVSASLFALAVLGWDKVADWVNNLQAMLL